MIYTFKPAFLNAAPVAALWLLSNFAGTAITALFTWECPKNFDVIFNKYFKTSVPTSSGETNRFSCESSKLGIENPISL